MCTTGHPQDLPEVIRSQICHISLTLTALGTLGLILGPFSAGLVVWVMSSETFPVCKFPQESSPSTLGVSLTLGGPFGLKSY